MTPDQQPEDTLVFPATAPVTWPTFGDMLTASMPGFDILPCSGCGAAFTGYPESLLAEARVLEPMVDMACDAGWGLDAYGMWKCPACHSAARDAAMEIERAWHEASRVAGYPDILAAYDRTARGIVERIGGTWKPRKWRYAEPAEPVAEAEAA